MNDDRWNQVDRLLQSALDIPAASRDAFVHDACGGDQRLEAEVRSLLAAHDRADGFLGDPAIELAARKIAQERGAADSLIGQTLSHYRIIAKLGGGGMGVVYKAEDSRLQRFVALKFLAPDLANDPDALSRFGREARAASALNHANICTIHDIGEVGGRAFIVMEFLEGVTLKDRLAAGPLEVTTSLKLGTQIAAALEAAHSAGIVHRDIKPANIFIGPRDQVKVLDFGIAKVRALSTEAIDALTMTATREGAVLGTAAYMAPEQARGETVDHRADIWSTGLVLWEMVSGHRPSAAGRVRVDGSVELERIISKCLEGDRALRYQHASDLRIDLERVIPGTAAIATPASRRARLLFAAVAIVIAAILVGWIYRPRAAALTDKDTIVLAEFTNRTGDAVFDDTLRQGLAMQLQQSPFLSLIPQERVSRTLRLMNQAADARLTPELAQEVCVRAGGTAVLEGSIAALGSQYVIGLRARHCTTGDILADEQAQASRKEDVLGTLSQIATRFRTRVGESLATVQKLSTPLEEATTSSLEALKAYTTGTDYAVFNWERRIPHYQRAIEIDPEFAMAHAQLGFGFSTLGETALGRQSLTKAYQLRHRASDLERLNIETLYDRDVTGNLEREIRTLETWMASYPRDYRPRSLIAGLALTSTGQHELAIVRTGEVIARNPDGTPTYGSRAFNQYFLNRFDDALRTVDQAAERKLQSPDLDLIPYAIAFLKGDEEEVKRAGAAARKSSVLVDLIPHFGSLALARAGRLQEARRVSAIPVEIAQRAGRRERAALFEAAGAVWEAFYGNAAAARQRAGTALVLGRGRNVDYAAAFALAISDDLRQARALADDLEREFPEDTFVQLMYLPTLRALFALNAHDPAAAIQALQVSSRYDLHTGGVGFMQRFGALYPSYVRGLAYLAARQPAEAAGEFQRIVGHPAIVFVDPIGAMARLQLARALELSGDTVKAKGAYDDLLTLWKNADARIPIVEQARAESARLR